MALATKRKPSTHQRKRQAHHHTHTKHYRKAYWPYLPMLIIVGLGVAINSVLSQSHVLGVQQDFSAQSLLQATNVQRLQQDQNPLSLNGQLSAAAQAKANDMAQHDYWNHISPSGQTPWALLTTQGYQYQMAGENLAYGFSGADQTIAGWMNSSEHRANLLNAGYNEVGFGVAQALNYQGRGPQTIVVAEYGQPQVANQADAVAQTSSANLNTQPVSRLEILAGGQAPWILLAVIVAATAAFSTLLIRHSKRWHKLLVKGEAFVLHHPFLDIAFTLLVVAGIILTRTSGIVG